ncbi:hypothetical protein D3C79_540330 [compost metagenome]
MFTHRLQQLIGTLAAQARVEARQPLDTQQQQVSGAGFFQVADPGVELHLEVTAVGQPGEAVLVRLGAQSLTAFSLFGEQRLELLDHLVHGLHHAAQLGCPRELWKAEELASGNRVGLLDHVVQRPQLTAQQQCTKYRTRGTAQQQPAQAPQGTLPELGDGKHRMADHLDPRGLLPATADNGIAARRFEADQVHEPGRHASAIRLGMTLHQHGIGAQVDDLDARIVTTVEDRTDHELDHRRVVDVRRQRQGQRGGRILGMRAQLVDVLAARAFQADHETATEGDHQEQANGQQQLFEQ